MEDVSLKELLPLAASIVVVVGWFVGYTLNRFQRKSDTFFSKTESNLKDILGPMVSEIDSIKRESHRETQLRTIDRFINKYSGTGSPLFLCSSHHLNEVFETLYKQYCEFKADSSRRTFIDLWTAILILDETAVDKIKISREVLFFDYEWHIKMHRMNPLLRLIFQLFRSVYTLFIGVSQITAGVLLLMLSEYIYKLLFNPSLLIFVPYFIEIISVSILIFLVYALLFAINIGMVKYRVREYSKPRIHESTRWYQERFDYPNHFL